MLPLARREREPRKTAEQVRARVLHRGPRQRNEQPGEEPHAEGQALVGRLGLELLRTAGLAPDAVGGLTMGADPVSYAMAHASWLAGAPVHAFSVRKQPKDHGTGKRVEGCFASGSRVVVVEDVITSGKSALQACDAVEAEGGTVLGVIALVDREGGGREAIEARGYAVHTIFSVSELLEAAGQV